jgi:predicted metal-dependent hydrolase
LHRWYREQLNALIPPLLEKWRPTGGGRGSRRLGHQEDEYQGGSCNAPATRIMLNLELATKPVQCLEYIVVHELVHLLERHHNDEFHALIDRYMPTWRLHRAELNRGLLAHQIWEY